MPFRHQHLPLQQPPITIQMQEINRGLSNWCQAHDACAFQREMIAPVLCAWIEKKDHLPCMRINRAKVSAFMTIAFGASAGKIVSVRSAFMTQRDDVVYLMCVGRIVLMQQAIFTAMMCSGQHKTAEACRDLGAGHRRLWLIKGALASHAARWI